MPTLATVQGLAYESPIKEFPVRSGPGTKNSELFKAQKGWKGLQVLDIKRDEQNTPNDSDRSRIYQWFKLQFPNGQTGWLREHVLTIEGDFSVWGYGVIGKATYAYILKRDESKTGPAASATTLSPAKSDVSSAASSQAPATTPTTNQPTSPIVTVKSGVQPLTDESVKPRQTIPATGAASNAWNNYGGLVEQLAREHNIQTATVLAILAIESGGSGFVNGRLKIRFENHIFRASLLKGGRLGEYDANFGGGLRWNDKHLYKEGDQLLPVHTGKQDSEWSALVVAQRLDAELGACAISMGASQVMGFNFKSGGFSSACSMLEAYSRSEAEHIRGMFNFLKNRGLVEPMRQNNFEAVALGYNGEGQVERYARLMRGAYDAVKPSLDAIGVK